MSVVVVTPTIPARRDTRDITLNQWRALGFEPIAVEQDPALPYCHTSNIITSRRAIRAGLETGADRILLAEDDIDVDPELVGVLPELVATCETVSLFNRPRFIPRRERHVTDAVRVVNAIGLRGWFSSLGLLLPRDIADALCTTDAVEPGGIDIVLREVLLRLNRPLLLTVPSLVQHRPGRRYASRSGMYVGALDYRGPLSS